MNGCENTVDLQPNGNPWLHFDYLLFVTVSLVIQTKFPHQMRSDPLPPLSCLCLILYPLSSSW